MQNTYASGKVEVNGNSYHNESVKCVFSLQKLVKMTNIYPSGIVPHQI